MIFGHEKIKKGERHFEKYFFYINFFIEFKNFIRLTEYLIYYLIHPFNF